MRFFYKGSTSALVFSTLLLVLPFNRAIGGELGITFVKSSDGSGGFLYGSDFAAVKNGASTCKLTIPMGEVFCALGEGELKASLRDLSFAQIEAETRGDWTLIIDEGLSTETTAVLDLGFGSTFPNLMENDWPPLPTIVSPLDGATGVSPSSSMEWSTDEMPNAENTHGIEVSLNGLLENDVVQHLVGQKPLELAILLLQLFQATDIVLVHASVLLFPSVIGLLGDLNGLDRFCNCLAAARQRLDSPELFDDLAGRVLGSLHHVGDSGAIT